MWSPFGTWIRPRDTIDRGASPSTGHASKNHRTPRSSQQAGDRPVERRFPRPVRAQNGDDFTVLHRQIDAMQDFSLAVSGVKPAHNKERLNHAQSSQCPDSEELRKALAAPSDANFGIKGGTSNFMILARLRLRPRINIRCHSRAKSLAEGQWLRTRPFETLASLAPQGEVLVLRSATSARLEAPGSPPLRFGARE